MIAHKIAYNIVISGIAKVLSIALALFGIGMLTRYLGPEGFGKYTLTLAFFAAFNAFGDFGLHVIATREISRPGVNESDILSKIFTLRLIISSAIFALVSLFVWFLPYTQEIRMAIFVVAAAFIFGSSYGFLNGLFQKHLAMDRVALAELIGKVLQMAIIIFLVYYKLPFLLSIIAIFIAMVSNFTIIYLFSRSFATIRLNVDKRYWYAFLRESFPMGISAIATFLYFKVDAILLSLLQNDHAVGVYGAAYKIIETLVFFPAMVVGLVYPLFSRYIFTKRETFLTIANTTLKFFLLIIVPLVIFVQFLAPDIIHIIGGDDYDASIGILRILIFALASIFIGQLFTNMLIAANLQKKLMIILLVAATFNIIANILLIPIYSYTGAAIVSVITEVFVAISALIVARYATPYRFPWRLIVIMLFCAGVMLIAFYVLPFSVYINTIIALFVYGLLIFLLRIITLNDIKMLMRKTL